MKFNKWTVGLAAVGVVSLASVASAEEKMSAVQTALSATTISGYVDTSAEWNPGTGNANTPNYKFGNGKADGFNLDVVKVTIEKALDESQWAAGYKVDLLYGPDANVYGTSSTGINTSDFAIKQAYVALRAPVGNGLDFKMGVFDSVIGYESFEAGNNPNFTRSYGHTIEPQTHTGLLAMYKFCDFFSASAGIADSVGPQIDLRTPNPAAPGKAESYKSYMGSIALTAPASMGFLEGSTLYGGVVNGYASGPLTGHDQTSWYAGATIKTPVTGLRVGASYDYRGVSGQALLPANTTTWEDAIAGYVSYQATEKLSFHGRGEYYWRTTLGVPAFRTQVAGLPASKVVALTGTIQYDLWQNVISRLEVRWDHAANGVNSYGGTVAGAPTRKNAVLVALNVIYKF